MRAHVGLLWPTGVTLWLGCTSTETPKRTSASHSPSAETGWGGAAGAAGAPAREDPGGPVTCRPPADCFLPGPSASDAGSLRDAASIDAGPVAPPAEEDAGPPSPDALLADLTDTQRIDLCEHYILEGVTYADTVNCRLLGLRRGELEAGLAEQRARCEAMEASCYASWPTSMERALADCAGGWFGRSCSDMSVSELEACISQLPANYERNAAMVGDCTRSTFENLEFILSRAPACDVIEWSCPGLFDDAP